MKFTYRAKDRNQHAGEPLSPLQVREKIVSALNNPTYKSRTVPGISKEVNLEPKVVLRAIKRDKTLAATVKVLPMRSKDGQLLFTTKDRFFREASLKEKFVDFFATHRQEIPDGQ